MSNEWADWEGWRERADWSEDGYGEYNMKDGNNSSAQGRMGGGHGSDKKKVTQFA